MKDLDIRLTRCFTTAFPDVKEANVPTIDVDNTPMWDSLGALVLRGLIQEEFGVRLDDEEVLKLRSYEAVRHELLNHLSWQ